MERTDILAPMGELKLYGMRTAYDDGVRDQASAQAAAHPLAIS